MGLAGIGYLKSGSGPRYRIRRRGMCELIPVKARLVGMSLFKVVGGLGCMRRSMLLTNREI